MNEYSNDYRQGYEEGIEAGRSIVANMIEDALAQLKSCAGCKYEAKTKWDVFYHCNECARYMSDGYEAKESE